MNTSTQTNVATLVAFLAGILAGRGVFGWDAATWTAILGAVIYGGMQIWTALATRKTSLVSAVNAMPEVKAVITTNTLDGKAMAEAIPAPTVVPEGTVQAAQLAQNGVTK